MMFDNKFGRRAGGVALGALLLGLSICVNQGWAQEAPRPQGSSQIKPPMIKPPMQNSKNANGGSVNSSSRRRRKTRSRRRALRTTMTTKTPGSETPGDVLITGGAISAPGGSPSIKPPMANNENAPLLTAPHQAQPISGGVLNGGAISLPKPAYPPIAKSARASGTVVVQVIVDEEGNVIAAHAISGHPLLQKAAVEAAQQAKFPPTKLSGQPVKVTGTIIYDFVL